MINRGNTIIKLSFHVLTVVCSFSIKIMFNDLRKGTVDYFLFTISDVDAPSTFLRRSCKWLDKFIKLSFASESNSSISHFNVLVSKKNEQGKVEGSIWKPSKDFFHCLKMTNNVLRTNFASSRFSSVNSQAFPSIPGCLQLLLLILKRGKCLRKEIRKTR